MEKLTVSEHANVLDSSTKTFEERTRELKKTSPEGKPNKVPKDETFVKSKISTWVNQETLEEVQTIEVMKPVGRNGFVIAYMETILSLLGMEIANKKFHVIKHVLENIELSNNTYIATTREIAQKTKSSPTTVNAALKALENQNIITRKVGSLMLNPKLLHRGGAKKEQALITRFYNFSTPIEQETE